MQHSSNVYRFPTTTRQRVDRASREAIRVLVGAALITELEAVRSLRDLGANEDEVDLVRTIFHVRRGRL